MALQTGELGGVTALLKCGMSRDAIRSIGNCNWNVRKKEFRRCEFFEEVRDSLVTINFSRSSGLHSGDTFPTSGSGRVPGGALAVTLEGIAKSRILFYGVLVLLFSI